MLAMGHAALMSFVCLLADQIACSLAVQLKTSDSSSKLKWMRREPFGNGTVVEVPTDTGAMCMDGSPFYFTIWPGTSTHWTFQFHDAGMGCFTFSDDEAFGDDDNNCEKRMDTWKGSSTTRSDAECTCRNYDSEGNNETCNCVGLLDCDGSLQAGHLDEPLTTPSGRKMYSRGRRNLQATLDMLLESYNLGSATDVVISGQSAGGVASFAALDAMASWTPDAKVRGLHFAGFTIAHEKAKAEGEYIDQLQKMYDFHNIGEQMPADCLADHSDYPHYCMLGEYSTRYIKTPMFVMNSRYDAWQMYVFDGMPWGDVYEPEGGDIVPDLKDAITAYGDEWMTEFQQFIDLNNTHATFVTSCICHTHCGEDNAKFLEATYDGKTLLELWAAWYNNPVKVNYIDDAAANYDCNGGHVFHR